MYAQVLSSAVNGIEGQLIEVEADVSNGLPQMTIVGLPDSSIRESSERVRTAIRNCGFEFPMARVTVNLAPADLRKEGSAFDLAIAIGILMGSGQLDPSGFAGSLFVGELALDGATKPVNGILSMVHAAKKAGYRKIYVPLDNTAEAGLLEGMEIIGISHLGEFRKNDALKNDVNNKHRSFYRNSNTTVEGNNPQSDFSDVYGQQHAKRTMTIAASGMHNLLLIGPPGSGKTMLLRRLPSIMPPLTDEEALEVMKIYSVAGLYKAGSGLWRERPFRSPHHTISYAGMLGGGAVPKPGEVSLAHRGVLFLDELPEFNRQVLEVLRQPVEDRFVTISRAKATLRYPTSFLLAASMNPCPCGYSGVASESGRCVCTPWAVSRYRAKLSGPLLDRIDLQSEVPQIDFQEWTKQPASGSQLTATAMKEAVNRAHLRQQDRYSGLPIRFNGELSGKLLQTHCAIPQEAMQLLKQSFKLLGLSARALDRILKIARTIADLDGYDRIETQHVAEAIQYRILDRAIPAPSGT